MIGCLCLETLLALKSLRVPLALLMKNSIDSPKLRWQWLILPFAISTPRLPRGWASGYIRRLDSGCDKYVYGKFVIETHHLHVFQIQNDRVEDDESSDIVCNEK